MTPRPHARPATRLRRLELDLGPARFLSTWPADRPLAALWSARPRTAAEARWSRWSIFAHPSRTVVIDSSEPRPLECVRALLASTALPRTSSARSEDEPPFVGGWIASLSYELGRMIEPRAGDDAPGETGRGAAWPRIIMQRCSAAYIHDGLLDRWWAAGDERSLPEAARVVGAHEGEAEEFLLQVEADRDSDRRSYSDNVRRTVEYIHAGDIFQANIARRLCGRLRGSARGLWSAMLSAADPWYGALVEWGDRAVLSASPELFLEFDPRTRRLITRPIKGTRAGDADPRELRTSDKDGAELNMIIDLMRNDLGRVCEYGSVRVDDARAIEHHAPGAGGGVLHGVATISGRLRDGLDIVDALAAAFPAGSITGAPKIRAMQIIDRLERAERGPYTGSLGYFSDSGHACLNVAIRTAAVRGEQVEFGVGAGIVADSDPEAEWRETRTKSSVLLAAAAKAAPARAVAP